MLSTSHSAAAAAAASHSRAQLPPLPSEVQPGPRVIGAGWSDRRAGLGSQCTHIELIHCTPSSGLGDTPAKRSLPVPGIGTQHDSQELKELLCSANPAQLLR